MELDNVLAEHFSSLVLDLRRTHNGRWMDQKVTPDVFSFLADCVLHMGADSLAKGFTKNDVWLSPYFESNVTLYFGKPNATNDTASSEYDKFCAQPLKTMGYAGILVESKAGKTNVYKIAKPEILQYIALSQANAFNFLVRYIRSVLDASGFGPNLDQYIASMHSKEDLQKLKDQFHQFTVSNTAITTRTEMARIFSKVINPIACFEGIPGTSRGMVSKYPINFSDLRYNDTNWRDVGKDKRLTRQEQAALEPTETLRSYETKKVMDAVRFRHHPKSEILDELAVGEATQVHHIFPRSRFPDLVDVKENLILLTPSQHYTKAHPSNNTNLIDKNYQLDCLIAKIKTVENADPMDLFYSAESMRYVLKVGLGMETTEKETWIEIIQRLQAYRD